MIGARVAAAIAGAAALAAGMALERQRWPRALAPALQPMANAVRVGPQRAHPGLAAVRGSSVEREPHLGGAASSVDPRSRPLGPAAVSERYCT